MTNKNDTLLNPFGDEDNEETDTESVTKESSEQERTKRELLARKLADNMNVDYLD